MSEVTPMNGESWSRLEELFFSALERDPSEWDAFVRERCADADERQRLRDLLRGHRESEAGFLAAPAVPATTGLPDIGDTVGDFRLTRLLATGGMATVYEAEQESPQRTVALKVMHPSVFHESSVRRFEYESEILARLRHPGIAQVYAVGTHLDGSVVLPWFAMELVPQARPITDHAKSEGLSLGARLELFAAVCDAVHHGHRKGVVHRDLKPGNILVDGSGATKIIDFGIARVTDADLQITVETAVGRLIGTLAYMSPEQCEASGDVDTASDVYSLGVVLYELLCGELPYRVEGVPVPAALRAITEATPRRPSQVNAAVPRDVEAVVLRALEKEPQRRYPSAAALADDLRRFLRSEPVTAQPATWTYQLRMFARRNRATVAAAITILAMSVIATLVSTRFAVHAGQRAAEAELARGSSFEMYRFLSDLFASAGPERGGKDVTVRELLDVASERIGAEFADRPVLRARLRATIADAYRELERSDEAVRHCDAALATLAAQPGDHRADVARLLVTRGLAQLHLGERAAARESLERSLAQHVELYGDEHARTAAALHKMGALEFTDGDLDLAEELLGRALAVRETMVPPPHRDLAESLTQLGTVRYQRGDFVAAERYWSRALDAFAAAGIGDHPDPARVLSFLALSLQRRGELDRAEARLLDALAVQERCLPEGHDAIGSTREKLAYVQKDLGKIDDAARNLRWLVDHRRDVHGDDHPSVAAARESLGYFLLTTGSPSDAFAELSEVERLFRAALPADHPRLSGVLTLRGRALVALGRAAEAEPVLDQALAIRRAKYGPDNLRTMLTQSALGECVAAQGRHEEGEKLLTASWAVIDGGLRGGDPEKEIARGRLRALYLAWGRPEQAAAWSR